MILFQTFILRNYNKPLIRKKILCKFLLNLESKPYHYKLDGGFGNFTNAIRLEFNYFSGLRFFKYLKIEELKKNQFNQNRLLFTNNKGIVLRFTGIDTLP